MSSNGSAPRLREQTGGREVQRASGTTHIVPDAADIAQQLRRRAASLRLPPLECGHRDPLDHHHAPDWPATFGLTRAELRAHANTLVLYAGWQLWEVLQRLDIRPTGCTCCPIHGKAGT